MTNKLRRDGLVICALIIGWLAFQSINMRIDQVGSEASSAQSSAYDAQSTADEAMSKTRETEDKLDRVCGWRC